MSGILNKEGIDHNIISFPGHVVTSVKLAGNKSLTYDPDFGVSIPYSVEEINKSPQLINEFYLKKGHSSNDVAVLNRVYKDDFQKWDGVEHFIRNKYYFERLAYFLKWPFPLILIFISSYLLLSKRLR